MSKTTIKLPNLFSLQKEIANHPARFKIIAAGRRFGKTRLCCVIALKAALEGKRVYWVAPFLKTVRPAWRDIKSIASRIPGVKILETEKRIEFETGGTIDFKTADNPDAMRGEGLDLVIIDEFGFVKKGVWTEVIRPMLSDREGSAVIISTPKGRGEFYRLFQKGLGDSPDWQSWHFASNLNPYFPKKEWEIAENELPHDVFRQEYKAEFLDNSAGVFRNIENCIKPIVSLNKNQFRQYVMGVDLAKTHDYTVLTILDRKTAELIELQRFNRLDWIYQKKKIVELAKKYNAQVLVDETGVGGPIVEDLKRESINIKGYKFNNSSKKDLINDLQVAFEKELITISPTEKTLIEELKVYEYQMSPSGNIIYNAPAGSHDDCVISLALAYNLTSRSLQKGATSVFLAR